MVDLLTLDTIDRLVVVFEVILVLTLLFTVWLQIKYDEPQVYTLTASIYALVNIVVTGWVAFLSRF